MVQQTTRDRVIFSLVRKNGQTYTELRKSAKKPNTTILNHNSLTLTLKQLVKEKIIVKTTDNEYIFSFEVKNKYLKNLPRAYDIGMLYAGIFAKLEKDKNNSMVFFKEALEHLLYLSRLQLNFKIERYAAVKLNQRDKLEFDMLGDLTDGCIEWIFEILNKLDTKKTQTIKNALALSLIPLDSVPKPKSSSK